jgi:hypothetical protein
MKKFVALAVLSVFAAAPAFADTQQFTRDGVSYRYEVKQAGSYQVISGRNMSTGENFTLRVQGSRVAGVYNGHAISFAAPESAAQVAAN